MAVAGPSQCVEVLNLRHNGFDSTFLLVQEMLSDSFRKNIIDSLSCYPATNISSEVPLWASGRHRGGKS